MHPGGYVGHVGALAVALGVGSAVALGLGCGVATADPTHSSTSSASSKTSAETPDRVKPKRQRAAKPRNPVPDTEVTSRTAMPPTTIYVGSREQAAPGALLYAKRMVDADPNADVTVVIGMGHIHDWAQGGPIPINSQSANYRDDVYRQLGIVADDDAESAIEL